MSEATCGYGVDASPLNEALLGFVNSALVAGKLSFDEAVDLADRLMSLDRGLDAATLRFAPEEINEARHALRALLAPIPQAFVAGWTARNLSRSRRAAMMACTGPCLPTPILMAPSAFREDRRVSIFRAPGEEGVGRWRVDGREVELDGAKIVDHVFFGDVLVEEVIGWLPNGRTEFLERGAWLEVHSYRPIRAQSRGGRVSWPRSAMMEAKSSLRCFVRDLFGRRRAVADDSYRGEAEGEHSRRTGRPVWLYVDRHDRAGDNAEPLYRYARSAAPEFEHIFALDADCDDWRRLSAEGFTLVDIRSSEFAELWCSAEFLLLADVGDPLVAPRLQGKATRRDQCVVFLQHGMTLKEMWRWFNGRRIDVLVTANEFERQLIIADHSSYTLTAPEVWATGFPRHDLLKSPLRTGAKGVLLAPTWDPAVLRKPEEDLSGFLDSWVEPWLSLAVEIEERGFTPLFFVHPKVATIAREWSFQLPIQVVTGIGLREVLSNVHIVVSDKSSVLDEAAITGAAPIIWDPLRRADIDAYRRIHRAMGVRVCASGDDVVHVVDDMEAGLPQPLPGFAVVAGASERLVRRLLQLRGLKSVTMDSHR